MINQINFFPNEEKEQIYSFFSKELGLKEEDKNKQNEFIEKFLNWAYEENEKDKNEEFYKSLWDKVSKYELINNILYEKLMEKKIDFSVDWFINNYSLRVKEWYILNYLLKNSNISLNKLFNNTIYTIDFNKTWLKAMINKLKKYEGIIEHNWKYSTNLKDNFIILTWSKNNPKKEIDKMLDSKLKIFIENIKSKENQELEYRIKKIVIYDIDNKEFFFNSLNWFNITDSEISLKYFLQKFKENNNMSSEDVFEFLYVLYAYIKDYDLEKIIKILKK
jgi:AraC-like DNA-binding protein